MSSRVRVSVKDPKASSTVIGCPESRALQNLVASLTEPCSAGNFFFMGVLFPAEYDTILERGRKAKTRLFHSSAIVHHSIIHLNLLLSISPATIIGKKNMNPAQQSTGAPPLSPTTTVPAGLAYQYSWTKLHTAVMRSDLPSVRTLLAEGADPEAQIIDGSRPLHIAASRGHTGVVQILLASGVDVNATDRNGRTALHIAAGRGRAEVVAKLLDAEADIEAADKFGARPLHLAAMGTNVGVVGVLLARGADCTVKEVNGLLPVEIAMVKEMEELLRKWRGDQY